MKLNFKKITSVIASVAMIGSVGLVAASAYPAPFLENSAVGGSAIVYGSGSAVSDYTAAVELGASFIPDEISQVNSVNFDGENYPLFTGSSKLFLGDSIDNVRSVLTYKELPTILSNGEFQGVVSADYTQRIEISNSATVEYTKQPDSNDEPTIGISLDTNGVEVYTNVIRFDKAVNFDDADSKGESIELFGQEFTVGSSTDSDKLVLYKSSETIDLSLGGDNPVPFKLVTIGGEQYTIKLIIGGDSDSTIEVTDSDGNSDTKELDEGDARKIQGLEIGLNRADESSALNKITAEITVGAEKVILKDGSKVKIGSDEDIIDGTEVEFEGDVNALRAIKIKVFQEDDDLDAIVEGSNFADPVFKTFKFEFVGIGDSNTEEIEVFKSEDNVMSLSMTDNQDNEKTIDWFNTGVLADDDGNVIHIIEGASINEDEYVVVGNEDEGYLLKLERADLDNSDYTDNEITLTNVFDSSEDFEAIINTYNTAEVYIGGKSYTITYDNSTEEIQLNYPDSSGNDIVVYPTIKTSNGALVSLYQPISMNTTGLTFIFPDGEDYGGNSKYNVTVDGITLLDSNGVEVTNPAVIVYEEKDDSGVYGRLILEVSGSGDNVEVSDFDVSTFNSGFVDSEDNNDISTMLDIYGTLIVRDRSDSDSTSYTIVYPDEQSYAELYVMEGTTTITFNNESANETVVDTSNDMLVIKDTEIDSVKDRNLIVVGGSCINTVAQTLLGYDRPICGVEFEADTGIGAGQSLIKMFTSPYNAEKVAMLIAGYNAEDTTSAVAKVKSEGFDTTI